MQLENVFHVGKLLGQLGQLGQEEEQPDRLCPTGDSQLPTQRYFAQTSGSVVPGSPLHCSISRQLAASTIHLRAAGTRCPSTDLRFDSMTTALSTEQQSAKE
jgi:hypothetical protein